VSLNTAHNTPCCSLAFSSTCIQKLWFIFFLCISGNNTRRKIPSSVSEHKLVVTENEKFRQSTRQSVTNPLVEKKPKTRTLGRHTYTYTHTNTNTYTHTHTHTHTTMLGSRLQSRARNRKQLFRDYVKAARPAQAELTKITKCVTRWSRTYICNGITVCSITTMMTEVLSLKQLRTQ